VQPPYPSSAAIEIAVARSVASARARGFSVHRIEYIAPSESWCKSLALIVFLGTDAELEQRTQDGSIAWFRSDFAEQLRACTGVLPFERMPEEISYEFDSHESVVRNYQGSYFLRLR
jgi:hypothetical protein